MDCLVITSSQAVIFFVNEGFVVVEYEWSNKFLVALVCLVRVLAIVGVVHSLRWMLRAAMTVRAKLAKDPETAQQLVSAERSE